MNASRTGQAGPITREAALRLALAARTLPGIPVDGFVRAMGDRLGLPLTEERLARVTVKDIKELLQGDDVVEPDVPADSLKAAVRCLWGEGQESALPEVETPFAENRVLRVAVASNTAENLDGHFGSCLRFLIYQVAEGGVRLVEIRSAMDADAAEDRNAARTQLVADCHLLCVQSIGGPAAAKVIRASVHPLKFPRAGEARIELERMQAMLLSPPPWIARALGRDDGLAQRFGIGQEENEAHA
jgi:nitrogen fixation protein NifX